MDKSDGYHTFDELYEHRNLLFLNLCLATMWPIWWKIDPEFPGYFCLYLDTNDWGQISYHLPIKYLEIVKKLCVHRPGPNKWDGHTSKDVMERLLACAKGGGMLTNEYFDEFDFDDEEDGLDLNEE